MNSNQQLVRISKELQSFIRFYHSVRSDSFLLSLLIEIYADKILRIIEEQKVKK